MKAEIDFNEYQGVLEWWIWVVLTAVGLGVVLLIGLRIQKIHQRGGSLVMPIIGIVVALFVAIGAGFMMNLGQSTEIDSEYVRARLSPWQRRYQEYAWEDIQEAFLRPASAHEWFGFGMPSPVPNGSSVINFGSDMGLQLIRKNGGSVFIGTRDSAGIAAVLDQMGFGDEE